MPRITVLGSGTSTGVPEVGCHCKVCQSTDPRDKRLRTSILYETDAGKNILFDCGPDFRQQAIRHGIERVDAIVITHEHVDHIGGIEDLRTIAWEDRIPIYAEQRVLDSLKHRLSYIFDRFNPYPGMPRFSLETVDPRSPFIAAGVEVQPIRVMHAQLPILGYRIGDWAFITDLKTIERSSYLYLEGLSSFFVNGLRMEREHLSHQTIEEAITLIRTVGASKSYLIHLSHQAPLMSEFGHLLSAEVEAAYDGLLLEMPPAPYRYQDCGERGYESSSDKQERLFGRMLEAKRMRKPTHSVLLFCEHEPVLTIGKHGKESNLIASKELLLQQGIHLYPVNRGGDITYHGPGQITGYPIFDLESFGLGIKGFVEEIEDCIIELLAEYGIKSGRSAGATGVWIEADVPERARKICAIGIRASRFCTMHGFALNVNTDTTYFSLINPCGFTDKGVTSMAKELQQELDFLEVKRRLEKIFFRHFSTLLQAQQPEAPL